MEFGINKCKSISIRRRKLENTEGFSINEHEIVEDLCIVHHDELYKYLGFLQLKEINHADVKAKLRKTFEQRVEIVHKSQLNAGNKIQAVNTFAIPVLTYSFGLIKWSKTDLDAISRDVRVLMTKYRMHHPKSAIERVVLPRIEGGRGVTNITRLHDNQINSLREYFYKKKEDHEMFRLICLSDKNFTPLNLANTEIDMEYTMDNAELVIQWKQKELHGTHPHQLSSTHVDLKSSNAWLQSGTLYSETEGFIMAIQDRVIATKNYRKFILKEKITDDRCRRCVTMAETIEHIIGGCTFLANSEYLRRHNNVCKIVHQKLAEKFQLLDNLVPYYKYQPQNVLENNAYKIYWDWPILTDQTIPSNRPDILLYNKEKKDVKLIDVAVPLSTNLQSTFSTKIAKYTDLCFEIQKMWHIKSIEVIPIIISATGVIPTTLLTQLEKLDMRDLLLAIQKSVILDTCHITRKFLSINL